jgi:predicted transcriptional regulator
MTRQQIEVIVAMYKEDCSYSEIAKVVGKTEPMVKHWVRNNRGAYALDRRRNLAEKANNPLSSSTWSDSKWNLRLGLEFIKRRWA